MFEDSSFIDSFPNNLLSISRAVGTQTFPPHFESGRSFSLIVRILLHFNILISVGDDDRYFKKRLVFGILAAAIVCSQFSVLSKCEHMKWIIFKLSGDLYTCQWSLPFVQYGSVIWGFPHSFCVYFLTQVLRRNYLILPNILCSTLFEA